MTNNLDIATDQAHELIAFISTLLFFNKTRATIHVFPKEGADLLASTIYIVDRSLISEEKNSEYIHYALISIDIH
jgi:hypothetical protein